LFDNGEGGDDAEPAVIFSAIGHGVVVRSDDYGAARVARGAISPRDIADRVNACLQARIRHERQQCVRDMAMRFREKGAGQAGRRLGPARQIFGQRHDAPTELNLRMRAHDDRRLDRERARQGRRLEALEIYARS